MPGITKATKLQLGLEGTAGTPVAASKIWRSEGQPGFNHPYGWVAPDEHVGITTKTTRRYRPKTGNTFTLPQTPATFEQLPMLFITGIDGTTAGTTSGVANGGTTNGYIYTYNVPFTAGAALAKTVTAEIGDNQQEYESDYCFTRSFSLSGAQGAAVMVNGEMEGHEAAKSTFTSLTLPAVEEILFQRGTIFSDAIGGTIGTTQVTNTWLGFNLDTDTGTFPVWTGDGSLDFTFIKNIGAVSGGTFIVEHDDFGEAVRDRWVAGSPRLVRLNFVGSALTGTGGTYATKLARFDMVVAPTDLVVLEGDGNGDNTVKYSFDVAHDATPNNFMTVTIVNTLSAIF